MMVKIPDGYYFAVVFALLVAGIANIMYSVLFIKSAYLGSHWLYGAMYGLELSPFYYLLSVSGIVFIVIGLILCARRIKIYESE